MRVHTVLLFGLAPVLSTTARAQTPVPAIVIASGSASAGLRPTAARLVLGIDNRAQTAAQAATENASRQRSLLAVLRSLGFAAGEAQVTSYSVRADVDYQTSKLRFYEASTEVSVAISDLDKVGRVVDSALASGATEINRIDYLSDSIAVARDRVLGEALGRAKRDAEALATAAGGHLGRLIEVSTLPPPRGSEDGLTLQPGMIGGAGYITIAPHDVTVSQTVYTRWEIAR